MADNLQSLITQKVATLADGDVCHVTVQATISRVAMADGSDSMLDAKIVTTVDERTVASRTAMRASDGADKAWTALSGSASALVDDHLQVVTAIAAAKAQAAADAEAAQDANLAPASPVIAAPAVVSLG